jgi:hypothetical protein
MKRRLTTILVSTLGALGAGFALAALAAGRADAEGIPSAPALFYAGTLLEKGVPFTGKKNLRVSLWTAEQAGSELCEQGPEEVSLDTGRFRIALDECLDAVRSNPNLWVQVDVGANSFPRRKLGAVPYAVEAERASQASGALAAQLVPSGAVMAFDLDACPPGWTEMTSTAGRMIVGTRAEAGAGLSARARGDSGGSESITLSEAQLPAHSHPVEDPGHTHPPMGASFIGGGAVEGPANVATNGLSFGLASRTGVNTTGIEVGSTGQGAKIGVMPPFVALLYCRKS